METSPNKKFLFGFIFGGIFASFLLLLFGAKKGEEILVKLLEDSSDFEKTLREKFNDFRSSSSRIDKITDKVAVMPQPLTRNQELTLRSLSSRIPDDFEAAEEKLSFTKSIKHSFRKNGKILTS